MLRLRLRVTQTGERLVPLREVLKVLDKITPPKQTEMFESDEDQTEASHLATGIPSCLSIR